MPQRDYFERATEFSNRKVLKGTIGLHKMENKEMLQFKEYV